LNEQQGAEKQFTFAAALVDLVWRRCLRKAFSYETATIKRQSTVLFSMI
jgi:hypothetical protein